MKSRLALMALLAAMPLVPAHGNPTQADPAEGGDPPAPAIEEHVRIALSDAFYRQRARIEMNLQPGGRFGEIDERDRKEVAKALDTMEALIGDVASVEELHPDDRAALFNAQDRANTLLTAARADSRVECRRMRVVGSRFKQTVCETVREWELQAEAGRQAIQSKQIGRVPISPGGGTNGPGT